MRRFVRGSEDFGFCQQRGDRDTHLLVRVAGRALLGVVLPATRPSLSAGGRAPGRVLGHRVAGPAGRGLGVRVRVLRALGAQPRAALAEGARPAG